ncbi:hypothetical protein BD626DRAFT_576447 [Schizophyllum amplum]|uniref:F-box domain-containing protein n=1 Tax=Schizophyllum amplum TaxID=97359 RepID=A0A550BTJ9_9AGAR|nr:hypothetical protein BD626DRAFT_576447 [Auriculariopsis ampla]
MASHPTPEDASPNHDGSKPSANSLHRAPTRAKGGRSKKGAVMGGKLAALSEFPLDVMYEIFCYLHPAQLLAVSRTNKTLRGALLRKNARWIWKASFRNAKDIPEPPTDLNEPQYAQLLFDKSCMYCLSPNAPHISWKARLRFCKRCMKTEFIRITDVHNDEDEILVRSFIRDRVHSAVEAYDGNLYPRAQVEVFCAEYNRIHNDKAQISVWLKDQLWIYQRISKHGDRLQDWTHRNELKRRQAEKDEIRQIRREFIYERLREIGLGDELEFKKSRDDLNGDWLLKTPQRLTHRGWKIIEQDVITLVQASRTKRLAREKEATLQARRDLLAKVYDDFLALKPLGSVFPVVGDLLTVDRIRTAIENTPVDQSMTWGTFRRLIDKIPQSWFVQWRQNADAALVNVVSRDLRRPATIADLSLASTHFLLRASYHADAKVYVKMYPDVLADASVVTRAASDSLSFRTKYWPWVPSRLTASRYVLKVASALVSLAGHDPDTTTRAEMELHDPWFISYPDSSESQRAAVMRWPYVMNEILQKNIKKLSVLSARCRWDFRKVGLGVYSGDPQDELDAGLPEVDSITLFEVDTRLFEVDTGLFYVHGRLLDIGAHVLEVDIELSELDMGEWKSMDGFSGSEGRGGEH